MNQKGIDELRKQVLNSAKRTFRRLTWDEIRRIEGDPIQATDLLQERYGYSRAEAAKRWNDFVSGTAIPTTK